MPSSRVDRSVLGTFVLALYVASVQWFTVLAAPFYYPSDGYRADQQYYYPAPSQPDSWTQPSQNGYYYSQPVLNSIAPSFQQSENVGTYNGKFNYYGVPGYEDYKTNPYNRYIWNDPYVRRRWDNYYQRYYYPSASAGSWDNRRDGSPYISKRRQDSGPSQDATTQAPTTVSPRPSVPRKKKLFVPNVWG